MKNILIKNTHVPRFMSCSCHEEPYLNYILHFQSPKFLCEVADSYDYNDLEKLRAGKFIFKEVELNDGEKDLLVFIYLLDLEYFNGKSDIQIYDSIMKIMDDMAVWHIDEIDDLNSVM